MPAEVERFLHGWRWREADLRHLLRRPGSGLRRFRQPPVLMLAAQLDGPLLFLDR